MLLIGSRWSWGRLGALGIGLALVVGAASSEATRGGLSRSPQPGLLFPDSTAKARLARHRAEISRLEAQLRNSTERDSIRFQLAIAWRKTGTVEGRQRAFDLFEKVRSKYFDRPEYHLERARTCLEGNRRADARDEFSRALRGDPHNLEPRLAVARILREYLLRYGQPEDADEALRFMAETVRIHPQSADAHLEYATCLQLARMYAPGDRAAQALAVIRETEQVRSREPGNDAARMLRAAALLDLGQVEDADRALREASTAIGPAGLEDRFERNAPSPLTWVDPTAARAVADSFPWSRWDPTPLTPANEAELEYRRRLLLADLFYGEPERGLRGWMTPRGELFVRYGPPRTMEFRLARWEEGEASIPVDLGLQRMRDHEPGSMGAPFLSPVQRWVYDFEGRQVAFDFADPTLQGDFVVLDGLQQAEEKLRFPLALYDTLSGRKPQYFFAAAGAREPDGRTRLRLALALPGASEEEAPDGHSGVRILDADGREIVATRLAPASEEGDPPPPDWIGRALHGELVVAPGRYLAEARLDLEGASGSFIVPIVARDFRSDRLAISDLGLALPPEIPNPGGVAAPGSRILVRYEVYNFRPSPDGKARYRNRFSVVPRAYALAASRQADSSASGLDTGHLLDGLGRTLDGITLTPRNYLDVVFPEREEPLVRGARGRFTFELDASTLDPGDYALTVAVEDRVAQTTVLAQSQVRVLDDAGVRALTRGE